MEGNVCRWREGGTTPHSWVQTHPKCPTIWGPLPAILVGGPHLRENIFSRCWGCLADPSGPCWAEAGNKGRESQGEGVTSGEEGVCVLNQRLHHTHHLDG